MNRRVPRCVVVGALALILASRALPARAQASPAVTLTAWPSVVTYGDAVSLSGTVSPPAGGETVAVVDAAGTLLAQATTGDDGTFAVALVPEASVTLRAVWGAAESPPLEVGVRAAVTVVLRAVRLFDRAVVRGTVAPPHPGGTVGVTVHRSGETVVARDVAVGADGRFLARFPVRRPGRYRVVASFGDADHLPGRAADGPRRTPLPVLAQGDTGRFVRLLEERLARLRYHLPGVDGRFGPATGDAVMAFTKVQGMSRRSTVDAAVWRALTSPRRPAVRARTPGFHIEVDQARQILVTVRDGAVEAILHVSTGAGGATRDGWFQVYRKLAGYSPGRLYYPSYFDGLRAIHGWPEVPPYPASHGCVRVPTWAATWIFRLAPLGTRILVHH